jgi:hypothetical protein
LNAIYHLLTNTVKKDYKDLAVSYLNISWKPKLSDLSEWIIYLLLLWHLIVLWNVLLWVTKHHRVYVVVVVVVVFVNVNDVFVVLFFANCTNRVVFICQFLSLKIYHIETMLRILITSILVINVLLLMYILFHWVQFVVLRWEIDHVNVCDRYANK